MDPDYYDDLSDDAALHKWPRDGTKLRAGKHSNRTDLQGHAGYASDLLERVIEKAGEIDAVLQAQGSFKHTSEYARNKPLMQILSAFAEVETHMERQWERHLDGQTVSIIDGEGRRLIDQATAGLFAHMKSYANALAGNRIGDPPESDLPAAVGDITPDSLKVHLFLHGG